MSDRTRHRLMFGCSLLGVVLLDIVTKQAVIRFLPLHHSRTVLPGFFNLVHIQNRGVAFGLLNQTDTIWKDLLLVVFPLAAVAVILWILFRFPALSGGMAIALGAILGGAAGNLLDRLRFKGVVDFLDFYVGRFHWPAFNLADLAISLGVGFLILRFWREE